METALFILTRILIVIAALGALGCCLVIPFTAYSILRVAFQKDSEVELTRPETPNKISAPQ